MAKKSSADMVLVESITEYLLAGLPVLPKKLLKTDVLQQAHAMPVSQMQILILLRDGPMSVGDLSRRLGIAKPNITPLINSLHTAELVSRFRDEADHRVTRVQLLPKGEERLQAIIQSYRTCVSDWMEKLSRSETKELNNALATLLRLLSVLSSEDS